MEITEITEIPNRHGNPGTCVLYRAGTEATY